MKDLSYKMERYKLRFEAAKDVVDFIREMHLFIKDYEVEDGNTLSFWSDLSFLSTLYIISEIPNGHVMYETFAPYDKYTGERSDENSKLIN